MHSDTGLACVTVRALYNSLQGEIDSRILVNDDASISSKFKHNPFLARFRFDCPSDRWTASKANEFNTFIDNKLTYFICTARYNIERSLRQF